MFIYFELINSPAFQQLSGTATRVLLQFNAKRVMVNKGSRSRHDWVVANNGAIQFTYSEAERKWKISRSAFARAFGHAHRIRVHRCSRDQRWSASGTDPICHLGALARVWHSCNLSHD